MGGTRTTGRRFIRRSRRPLPGGTDDDTSGEPLKPSGVRSIQLKERGRMTGREPADKPGPAEPPGRLLMTCRQIRSLRLSVGLMALLAAGTSYAQAPADDQIRSQVERRVSRGVTDALRIERPESDDGKLTAVIRRQNMNPRVRTASGGSGLASECYLSTQHSRGIPAPSTRVDAPCQSCLDRPPFYAPIASFWTTIPGAQSLRRHREST